MTRQDTFAETVMRAIIESFAAQESRPTADQLRTAIDLVWSASMFEDRHDEPKKLAS